MVRHISFREERYRNAAACIRAIRLHIEDGWRIVDIDGSDRGPLAVVYGRTLDDRTDRPAGEER